MRLPITSFFLIVVVLLSGMLTASAQYSYPWCSKSECATWTSRVACFQRPKICYPVPPLGQCSQKTSDLARSPASPAGIGCRHSSLEA